MKLFVCTALICSLVLTACQSNHNQELASSLVELNLESLLHNQQEITLTDIADEISYIRLETNTDIVCQPLQYIIRGDRIFTRNRNQTVYMFDTEGRFIRQIGQKGPGPNEYAGVQNLDVSPNGKRLYFYFTRQSKVYVYSPDGEKISEFSIPYTSWRFAALSDDRHVMISPYGAFSPDSAAFLFYITDGDGNVLKKYPANKVIQMMGDFSIGRFSITPKSVLGYHPFNDTVFAFDQQGNKSSKYLFDFGSKRVPDEAFDDMMKYMNERDQYIHSPVLVETSDRLFVRVSHQKKYWPGIYDYGDGAFVAIQAEKGKLLNNFDGGPDFWPAHSDGNKTVYKLLQPVDLVEARDNGDFKGKDSHSSRAGKTFETMLQQVKEDDNPIIMLVKLK